MRQPRWEQALRGFFPFEGHIALRKAIRAHIAAGRSLVRSTELARYPATHGRGRDKLEGLQRLVDEEREPAQGVEHAHSKRQHAQLVQEVVGWLIQSYLEAGACTAEEWPGWDVAELERQLTRLRSQCWQRAGALAGYSVTRLLPPRKEIVCP